MCLCVCMRVLLLQVEAGAHYHIAQRLRATTLSQVNELVFQCPTDCPDQAKALRAALTVARAITCPVKVVRLTGWVATPTLVSELSGLPEWHSTLVLTLHSPTEPKSSSLLAWIRAATLIPQTYHTWELRACKCTCEELTALVSAVPCDRTVSTPLKISVNSYGDPSHWEALTTLVEDNELLFPHLVVV